MDQTNHQGKTAFDLLNEAGNSRLASMIKRVAFTFDQQQRMVLIALKEEVRQLRAKLEASAQAQDNSANNTEFRFEAADIEMLQQSAKGL